MRLAGHIAIPGTVRVLFVRAKGRGCWDKRVVVCSTRQGRKRGEGLGSRAGVRLGVGVA